MLNSCERLEMKIYEYAWTYDLSLHPQVSYLCVIVESINTIFLLRFSLCNLFTFRYLKRYIHLQNNESYHKTMIKSLKCSRMVKRARVARTVEICHTETTDTRGPFFSKTTKKMYRNPQLLFSC